MRVVKVFLILLSEYILSLFVYLADVLPSESTCVYPDATPTVFSLTRPVTAYFSIFKASEFLQK